VGGGLVEVPGGRRHGPANSQQPPPDGPWEEVVHDGRLVGWVRPGQAAGSLRRVLDEGDRLGRQLRTRMLERLGHKLRSSVLALQESARQAAFGRQELLVEIYEQALDVGRRARALEAVALEPKDPARAVALGAALSLAAPGATRELPASTVVRASEPSLVETLTRAYEWMGGPGCAFRVLRAGAWWRVDVTAAPNRKPLALPELGEPLTRLLVESRLGGWLEVTGPGVVAIFLPAP
jgi:hypothetical protein